ncbi:MAG: hypothetical protein NDJ89_18555 [Oligoflexia bacterium]|nr:hypothetical protein [Oligoflexia bacterium]
MHSFRMAMRMATPLLLLGSLSSCGVKHPPLPPEPITPQQSETRPAPGSSPRISR